MAFRLAKCISTVATAIALTIVVPGVAYSQTPSPNATPRPAQNQPASPSNRPSPGQQSLNLTAEQRQRLQSIDDDAQRQIEAVLTKEQKDLIAEARRSRQQINRQTLNLTQNQISQIQQILQSAADKIQQVLTPEQIRQLQNQSTQNRSN